jgi:hypothetical protein
VLEEGMLFAVERQIGIHIERRNPFWTILIKIVVKLHKALNLRFVFSVNFFDLEHEWLLGENGLSLSIYNTLASKSFAGTFGIRAAPADTQYEHRAIPEPS